MVSDVDFSLVVVDFCLVDFFFCKWLLVIEIVNLLFVFLCKLYLYLNCVFF